MGQVTLSSAALRALVELADKHDASGVRIDGDTEKANVELEVFLWSPGGWVKMRGLGGDWNKEPFSVRPTGAYWDGRAWCQAGERAAG